MQASASALVGELNPEHRRAASNDRCRRLLRACRQNLAEAADEWAQAGNHHKGLPRDHSEEWLVGPTPVLRHLRQLELAWSGSSPNRSTPQEVPVVPADPYDRVLFRGYEAIQNLEDGDWDQGPKEADGAPVVILGAGNVASIPAMDVLTKIFNEGKTAVVKLSPVNAWAEPSLRRALAPLEEAGWLRWALGGAELGEALVHVPEVSEVHLTGSIETHDRMVWGDTESERADRKTRGAPKLAKPVTSELGNVSPVAVVPAVYSEAELLHLARTVVASVVNNASFNCNATRVVLVAAGWHQKNALRRQIERMFEETPLRLAYYPGASDRYDQFLAGRSSVWRSGPRTDTKLPWTLTQADPSETTDLYTKESFCPILTWVELDVAGSLDFLDQAAQFMNERLFGTLNAAWFLPDVMKKGEVMPALLHAIDRLEYGTVAVNLWPALGFAWGGPVWGGHPGGTLLDPRSGVGWVHNAWMLPRVTKSVLWGPSVPWPKPVWFTDHRSATEVARKLVAFEHRPSWLSVAAVGFPALLG